MNYHKHLVVSQNILETFFFVALNQFHFSLHFVHKYQDTLLTSSIFKTVAFLTPCPSWKSPNFVQVLEICVAIVVHKSIIVFSLAVKLVQSGVPPLWLAAYVGVFAMMSPVGIAIGISVMEAQLSSGALIQAVLEGLAAGTFIYITFLEILPHELNSSGKQLLKVLFILLGFGIMAALTFLG